MVHTVFFFVCKLSARPQFSIFHFQFSILHLIKAAYTNWVRRLAVSQIKKVGKQKFCIENLLPDFNL